MALYNDVSDGSSLDDARLRWRRSIIVYQTLGGDPTLKLELHDRFPQSAHGRHCTATRLFAARETQVLAQSFLFSPDHDSQMIRLATASHRHLRLCLEISDWLEKLGMSEHAQRWKPWERISYSARRSQKGGRSFHPQEALRAIYLKMEGNSGRDSSAKIAAAVRRRRSGGENWRNRFYPRDLACARLCPGRNRALAALERLCSASDELLKKEIAPEAEKALGVKLKIGSINGNDLQARTTSAIQSGSGPDLICGLNNWPQLYAESVANVDDIVDEIGRQGGFYEKSRVVANNGQKWLGVPWCVIGAMIVYRKSWFAEQGADSLPATWEEYRAVGKKLKAAGHPIGQTLGHTFGDAPGFTIPLSLVLGR